MSMKLDSTVPDGLSGIPIAPNFPYASMRADFDLSSYLVLGPADTHGRPVADVVSAALRGGVTFVQLRAKNADARTTTALASSIATAIANSGVRRQVPLVIDDRVDVAWQCRRMGVKVDGVHIGQDDLQPDQARAMLGDDAIIGLSAKTLDEVATANALPQGCVDYLGAGPWHPSITKPDCVVTDAQGAERCQSAESLNAMCSLSRVPIVVGGGVGENDMADLAGTNVAGWFVVSAIAGAKKPEQAARAMVEKWQAARR